MNKSCIIMHFFRKSHDEAKKWCKTDLQVGEGCRRGGLTHKLQF